MNERLPGLTKRLLQAIRRRWIISTLTMIVIMFLGLNILAYRHAYAMTHFTTGGGRTPAPESLTTVGKVQVLISGVKIAKPSNEKDPLDVKLPFETLLIDSTDGISCESWYVKHPSSRRIVILFPGYSQSKSDMLTEATAFYSLATSVLLFDFRGCGGSDGMTTTLGFNEAFDVESAVAFVRSSLKEDRIILYGRSMGAVSILEAIARRSLKPEAVILEAPFDRLINTVRHRFEKMKVPSFPSAELLVFWGGWQHGFSGFELNPSENARHVTCPVLQLHGVQDSRVSIEEARRVFTSLGGSKEFVEFDDAGHEPCIHSDRQRWDVAVGRFLNRVDENTSRPISP